MIVYQNRISGENLLKDQSTFPNLWSSYEFSSPFLFIIMYWNKIYC